jgi:hypothetical protein
MVDALRNAFAVLLYLVVLAVTASPCEHESEFFDSAECEGHMFLLQAHFSSSEDSPLLLSSEPPQRRPRPVSLLHIPYNHIAVNLTYTTLMEEIVTFPERKPRDFNVILATLKTWGADAIVQLLQRRRGVPWVFDWYRSAAFAIFGFFYIGIMQWFLYVSILTWLFPDAMVFANAPFAEKMLDSVGQLSMVGQIFVDNFVFAFLFYFPAFYFIKSVVQGGCPWYAHFQVGLSRYWQNIVSDNLYSCALWFPADIVIFAMPMYFRMPMEHSVSFAWTMFISARRGQIDRGSKKPAMDQGDS